MFCWACEAAFTKRSRRANEVICFHDIAAETDRIYMKSVTNPLAQSVTNPLAQCREGLLFRARVGRKGYSLVRVHRAGRISFTQKWPTRRPAMLVKIAKSQLPSMPWRPAPL